MAGLTAGDELRTSIRSSLPEAEQLSCQVHQPLLVLADGAVAERDGPHSLHQSESLVLAETPAQPGGVPGKAGLAIVLGLRRGLPSGVSPQRSRRWAATSSRSASVSAVIGIGQLQHQQGRGLPGRAFGDLRSGQKRWGRRVQCVTGRVPDPLPLPAPAAAQVRHDRPAAPARRQRCRASGSLPE